MIESFLDILDVIFKNKIVQKTSIKLEKLDIVRNTESVGIKVEKLRC